MLPHASPWACRGKIRADTRSQLSVHVRGPIQLKSFAVYTPGTKQSRRDTHTHSHSHKHKHGNGHRHNHQLAERAVGDMVTVTMNGQVVSWTNEYNGPGYTATAAPAPTTATTLMRSYVSDASSKPKTVASSATKAAQTSEVPSSSTDQPTTNGAWTRVAYYDAEQAISNGLVFLNHFGGQGSGVFDNTFGNSLSFANSSGTGGSSTSQILADTLLPSVAEVVIMTNQACGEQNGACGYYRPGSVPYHGFDGEDKAFFFEFNMPNDGQNASNPYDPANMPAIWFLNAQIPRTLQYGPPDCSAWTTGGGEFDVFEVLTSGYTMAKSTIHANKAGGDSSYFVRPESGYIKLSVIMSGNNFHLKTLDDDVSFDDVISSERLNGLVDSCMDASNDKVSIYSLTGAGSG